MCQVMVYAVVAVAGLPQKRPGRKLAAAIRQYLLHERGMCHLQIQAIPCCSAHALWKSSVPHRLDCEDFCLFHFVAIHLCSSVSR